MAISIDSHSQNAATSGTTLSWSHTCASGAVLIVGASIGNQNQTVTGVTYNGVALTKIVEKGGGDACYASLWYLANPASGANTITVTYSANPSPHGVGGIGLSLTGVSSSVVGVSGSTDVSPAAASISTSVTTTAANSMVVAYAAQNGNSTSLTVSGSNQTQQDTTGKINSMRSSLSTQTTTSTGSYTNSWSSSPNEVMKQVVAEILEQTSSASVDAIAFGHFA